MPGRIARVTGAMTAFLSAALYPDDSAKVAAWAMVRRDLPCK